MRSASVPTKAGCMCIAMLGTLLAAKAASADPDSCKSVDVADGVDDASPIMASSVLQHASQRSKNIVDTSDTETEASAKPYGWACANKVRKDWNDLTQSERELYFDAVNALKNTPRQGMPDAKPGNNIYDAFTIMHHHAPNENYAHGSSGFLAWHRKYLLEYEETIRHLNEKFSCVTIPYVDWSSEMYDCMMKENVPLSQPPCDTFDGASPLLKDFGGPGTGMYGCVTKGPFAGWVDHEGNCLQRGTDWRIQHKHPFATKAQIAEVIQIPNFGSYTFPAGFRLRLEDAHGQAHVFLDGHMKSMRSPSDPIFFSHHAYIDKIWATWQDCHDHDEPGMRQKLVDDPEAHQDMHESTGDYDKATDPMIFHYPQGDAPEKYCFKEDTTGCSQCVHWVDSWCRWNDWDQQCHNQCKRQTCSNFCVEALPAAWNMHIDGPKVFPGWKTDERTPADMHSVFELANGRHYSYSPDEFERYLDENFPEHIGSCKIDSHKAAQASQAILAEVRRYHHTGTPRGHSAQMYATALRNTLAAGTAHSRSASVPEVLKAWEQKDCSDLAKAANHSDYKKAFNCSLDQPRNMLQWLGNAAFKIIMRNSTAAKQIFMDACCQ